MRSRKTVGLTMTALAAFVVATVSVPGCGGEATTEIQQDKPVTDELKGSMDYMKSQRAGKKAGSSKAP